MQKPSWKIRRRIIHLTLVFCAGCIVTTMVKSQTGATDELIIMCTFGLAFAVIGSYVFGAAWDDRNYMMALKGFKGQLDDPVPQRMQAA